MSFTVQFDDNFTNSPVSGSRGATYPTAFGTSANSTTGVGNGWIDFLGGEYNLPVSGTLGTQAAAASNLPLNSLYRPSGENYQNGYVRAWGASGNVGVTARFAPANGGSGYAAMLYGGNSLYVYKAVNGTQSNLLSGQSLTVPSNYVFEMVLSTPSTGTTQLTFNVYAQTDPSTVVSMYTMTDTTSALQTAGAWGVSSYGQANWDRVQTAVQGSALTAGTVSKGIVSRTAASLNVTAPIGGTAPYTYQWKRGTASGTETTISGATSASLTDTGLTPGTTYYYTCAQTDAAGASVTTTEVGLTTLAANARVIVGVGDSTMVGYGTSNPQANNCLVKMGQALVSTYGYTTPGIINDAVSGTSTASWQPSTTLLNSVEADVNTYGATDIWLRLGVNDSQNGGGNGGQAVGVTAAAYQSNLAAIVADIHTHCPSVRVWLSYPTYVQVGNQWDATSQSLLSQYQASVQNIVTANPSFVKLGNTAAFAFFQNHPSEQADGVHPNDQGAADLGGQDAAAFAVPAITSPATATATVGQAFSYQIAATGNPTSYGATGLPPGLTRNASTGLISGTPTP